MSCRAWAVWAVTFLCACSAAVPALPVGQPQVLVIHPGGYKPIDLTPEELQQGMRMLYANGPLPGLPRSGKPRFVLASANAFELQRAVGYLEHCQHITGKRIDCWDDLNASGGLDDEGATYVALHFALGEALDTAAVAVGSMTPTQVRAIMSMMFLGMVVELLAPEPVSKVLFVVSATSLIACVGVDIFNNVVKGFTAMLEDLGRAQDFAAVRAAGVRYGQRIGPTVGRIVVMVATYGLAKFAGLFKGSLRDLPGGSRAATLAEAQGFRLSEVEGARSIALGADGSVAIDLGTGMAMAAVNANGRLPSPSPSPARFDPTRDRHIFRSAPGHVNPSNQEDKARYIRLFERVASDPANRRLDAVQAGIIPPSAADAGVQAFTFVDEVGQVWVTVRNGLIENAGVNPPGEFR